ncbi:uncharacterized oxidoreductase TM_0325-like [Sitodiplosis mosellana]|uniref:uncharacterized oxidoreductase TM_0325-like n=1 Tax=Sitodiplosis mosellana TaxID=263140 RepID=UPI002444D8DE|nr:uncharacterized oxidoreductase TM_0325-like [Sitodiplosis mosellana]
MGFEGKVVIVTGGSSGIGAGAAIHLAKLGAKVAIVGRNEKGLAEVAEQIKNSGSSSPLQIVADVTKDGERIVDETIKQFGRLDVLLNNAGISVHNTICDMNCADFDRVFDTNVRSVITLTQLCLPHLEKTKGNIVNVSSIAGLKPIPTLTAYSISKAALDQLTRCCALDLASKGIRVNAVNPAVIQTPIFQKVGMTDEMVEKLFEQVKSTYPVGRVGKVTDTSAAIAFLADNEIASFFTGINLPVDGGAMVAGVGYKPTEN